MHIDLIRKLIVTECTRAKQIVWCIPHYLQLQAWAVYDPHTPLTVSWLVCESGCLRIGRMYQLHALTSWAMQHACQWDCQCPHLGM